MCTSPQEAVQGGPPHSPAVRKQEEAHMPVDLNGYWKMISNENFEEYMKALGAFVESFVEVDERLAC